VGPPSCQRREKRAWGPGCKGSGIEALARGAQGRKERGRMKLVGNGPAVSHCPAKETDRTSSANHRDIGLDAGLQAVPICRP